MQPSLSDCVFIFVLVWLFVVSEPGWNRLLEDGDIGWHIRVGQSILETGAVPRTDPFSFSKPGATWYAWEWLSDVVYAASYQLLGLKGVVLTGGVLIGLFGTVLIWYMLWRGANTFVALGVGLLGLGASSIHYLARPHLFTLVLVIVALWVLERDRRRQSALVWVLVPLTALWANLHGGFLALLACLGVLVSGSGVEALIGTRSGAAHGGQIRRYALLTAACAMASLLNPYGAELHRHIVWYLRSDWIRDVVQEFQSPGFRSESTLQFEVLLFAGLLAAAGLLGRRRVVEALWIVLWGHLALSSVRHVPIFVAVAAPLVASEASLWWKSRAAKAKPGSVVRILEQVSTDLAPGFRRVSVWGVLAVLFLVAAGDLMRWPRDFPADRFPVAMIHRHAGRLAGARVFTEDQWADYLIYRFYPNQRVFLDGRSDFYGPEIGNQYIGLLQGRHDWAQILDRYAFDLVLSPPEWPLASLLKQDAGWELLDDDGQALLFTRRGERTYLIGSSGFAPPPRRPWKKSPSG